MKAVLVLLFLALYGIASAEIYNAKVRPVIPALVLSDGRTLKDAKILSDTAYTVNVASGGRVEPLDKKLLPPELLALWPIDEVRGAADREKARLIAQAAADKLAATQAAYIAKQKADAARSAAMAESVKREREEKAAEYAAKTKAEEEARELAFKISRADLAASRDGIIIRGVGSDMGKIYVVADNVSDATVTFDWRMLRFSTKDGASDRKFSGVIFDKDEVENYSVPPHRYRVFLLRQIPVLELSSMRWEDRPDVYSVRQLYRLRSAWDSRDHRMDFKPLPSRGEPLPDDELTRILMAASRRYVNAPLN